MKHRIHHSLTIAIILAASVSGGVWAQESSLPIRELQTFTEIFGKIKQHYVEPVEDDQLLEDSIRGMLLGLDAHSVYLNAEDLRESRVDISGRFGGIGIEATRQNQELVVVAPIEGTPAHRAGIESGDRIVRINSRSTREMTLEQMKNLLRGAPGTAVRLSVRRAGAARLRVFRIKRALIRVRSVKSRMLEGRYGYIRITQFQTDTTRSLHREIRKLKREAGGALDGMVIDLRNNPGGVLGAAVGVSGVFLESGIIVSTRGRTESATLQFEASPPDFIDRAPLVVLVNRGSASASEIVAGALQDHGRAVVLGERSFGKGSVQSIIHIGPDAALKLTTGIYHTPNGRSIHGSGIEPDVVVRNLRSAAHVDDDEDASASVAAADDLQLQAALELLKDAHLNPRRTKQ